MRWDINCVAQRGPERVGSRDLQVWATVLGMRLWFFWCRVSFCITGWSRIYCVAQASLKLSLILLPHPLSAGMMGRSHMPSWHDAGFLGKSCDEDFLLKSLPVNAPMFHGWMCLDVLVKCYIHAEPRGPLFLLTSVQEMYRETNIKHQEH